MPHSLSASSAAGAAKAHLLPFCPFHTRADLSPLSQPATSAEKASASASEARMAAPARAASCSEHVSHSSLSLLVLSDQRNLPSGPTNPLSPFVHPFDSCQSHVTATPRICCPCDPHLNVHLRNAPHGTWSTRLRFRFFGQHPHSLHHPMSGLSYVVLFAPPSIPWLYRFTLLASLP